MKKETSSTLVKRYRFFSLCAAESLYFNTSDDEKFHLKCIIIGKKFSAVKGCLTN